MRQGADIFLGETGLLQGAAHAELRRRAPSRPVIAAVVQVSPISHMAQAEPIGNFSQLGEELLLTVVAAIRRIGHKGGVLQFVGGQCHQPHAHSAGEGQRALDLVLGIRWRGSGRGDGTIAKDIVRHAQQQRAIHATRVGDEHRIHLPENVL